MGATAGLYTPMDGAVFLIVMTGWVVCLALQDELGKAEELNIWREMS